MATRQTSPSSDLSHSDNVCKACDRCRFKKSKCDGRSPCSRCRADNAICVFGERKKAHDKVYPKGYVEMLEQQQAWLVHGLQELYRRSTEGEGWPGDLLKPEPNGHPLTHDLLTHLGALNHSKSELFEENPELIRHELWCNGMTRQESTDGSTDSPHAAVARSRFSSSAFLQRMPPIPPSYSPSDRVAPMPQHQSQPIKPDPTSLSTALTSQSEYALSMQGVVNPLALHGAPQTQPQWAGNSGLNLFDEMDSMSSADYASFNFQNPIPSMFHRQMPLNRIPSSGYDDFKDFFN